MELHCINSFVLGLHDESNVADTLWGGCMFLFYCQGIFHYILKMDPAGISVHCMLVERKIQELKTSLKVLV